MIKSYTKTEFNKAAATTKAAQTSAHFRWVAGMLVGHLVRHNGVDAIKFRRLAEDYGSASIFVYGPPQPIVWIDFKDPATLGCLIYLASVEAMHCRCGQLQRVLDVIEMDAIKEPHNAVEEENALRDAGLWQEDGGLIQEAAKPNKRKKHRLLAPCVLAAPKEPEEPKEWDHKQSESTKYWSVVSMDLAALPAISKNEIMIARDLIQDNVGAKADKCWIGAKTSCMSWSFGTAQEALGFQTDLHATAVGVWPEAFETYVSGLLTVQDESGSGVRYSLGHFSKIEVESTEQGA